MEKQVIISINRECGAGGQEIATKLAKKLQIPVYDSNIIVEVAKELGTSVEELEKYDEKARNVLFARKVLDYYNSNEDIIAENQFNYLKSRAEAGESFVVLGRCSDIIFRDDARLVSVFVTSEIEKRIPVVMEREKIDEKEAKELIAKTDKRRRAYHDSHTQTLDWSDARCYDLCIDALKIGIDNAVDVIATYVTKS